MNRSEALELLRYHSSDHDDIDNPKWETGFLGMLRPFRGNLLEENFHELMAILKVLAPDFRNDKIDREIVNSFWGICHFGKAWGVDPEGMLRQNNLIEADQIKRLATWIDCISYTVALLLNGIDNETAFEVYESYKRSKSKDGD